MSPSRFAVGIDLGTTHCALAYAAAADDAAGAGTAGAGTAGAGTASAGTADAALAGEVAAARVMPVPQLTAPGTVEDRALLPSFLYLPHPDELPPDALALPWSARAGVAVGELARTLGAKTPIRLVSSAKSWLSHPAADRRGRILPAEAPDDVLRVSPVDASVRYLEHLRNAWNEARPDALLAEQDVVITVPASFDPAARDLTAEAAGRAGLTRAILLEEPQAALYSWIEASGDAWRERVRVGDVVLVVDVGGGTTDFSLVEVQESGGALELRRVAVGDHILLGGDNMDLALAHLVRSKLEGEGQRLDAWQLLALTHACRGAKEKLLTDAAAEAAAIVVPSRGARLIGGTLRTELRAEEVVATVLDGFFPVVDPDARPVARARTALTQLGLPYAQDPGVTRHLAAFLARHEARPTALLLNGGVFRSPFLAERLVAVLNGWLAAAGAPAARALAGTDVDLAVARGAAYYGRVRRGRGVRIRGGTARSFYVGIESAMPAVPGLAPPVRALCVAPFGMEEGTEAELPPQEFGLVVGEPVRFRFFGSTTRREDAVGAVVESWDEGELDELPEIEATLPGEGRASGEVVPVRLHAAVTEVGTLRLEALPRSGPEHWKIEFAVREPRSP